MVTDNQYSWLSVSGKEGSTLVNQHQNLIDSSLYLVWILGQNYAVYEKINKHK